jgi:hypothetical protein
MQWHAKMGSVSFETLERVERASSDPPIDKTRAVLGDFLDFLERLPRPWMEWNWTLPHLQIHSASIRLSYWLPHVTAGPLKGPSACPCPRPSLPKFSLPFSFFCTHTHPHTERVCVVSRVPYRFSPPHFLLCARPETGRPPKRRSFPCASPHSPSPMHSFRGRAKWRPVRWFDMSHHMMKTVKIGFKVSSHQVAAGAMVRACLTSALKRRHHLLTPPTCLDAWKPARAVHPCLSAECGFKGERRRSILMRPACLDLTYHITHYALARRFALRLLVPTSKSTPSEPWLYSGEIPVAKRSCSKDPVCSDMLTV